MLTVTQRVTYSESLLISVPSSFLMPPSRVRYGANALSSSSGSRDRGAILSFCRPGETRDQSKVTGQAGHLHINPGLGLSWQFADYLPLMILVL